MNIIFTDIDGVLNPHFRKNWNKKSILLYNKICKDFNLYPVLTSTLRVNHNIEVMNRIFKEQGIEHDIFDFTKVLDNEERGKEIKLYLESNKEKITNYVIIDDRVFDILPYIEDKEKVIKCTSYLGLENYHYDLIKKIFK